MTRTLSEFEIGQRQAIGDCFAIERVELGMTQRQLAKAMGRNQAQVSCFERGRQDFKFSTLQEWAEFFGYSVEVNLVPLNYEEEEETNDTTD